MLVTPDEHSRVYELVYSKPMPAHHSMDIIPAARACVWKQLWSDVP